MASQPVAAYNSNDALPDSRRLLNSPLLSLAAAADVSVSRRSLPSGKQGARDPRAPELTWLPRAQLQSRGLLFPCGLRPWLAQVTSPGEWGPHGLLADKRGLGPVLWPASLAGAQHLGQGTQRSPRAGTSLGRPVRVGTRRGVGPLTTEEGGKTSLTSAYTWFLYSPSDRGIAQGRKP